MYGLVDCNNFYASCEQVFNPAYRNRPLVVLSNNDGCVIARSKEAKQLGIPMGAPAFEYKSLFLLHDVIILSSNFPLYGDLSERVIETMKTFGLPIEVYSIDEAFIAFPKSGALELAREMRRKVLQWTGITVSIGLAPTKTQAKIANHEAKKGDGVTLYRPELLNGLPIDEIWGIGRRWKKKLYSHRVRYAHELINLSDTWIKKQLTVVGLRTVMELRGTPCIEHEEIAPRRKSILSSRSFGRPVSSLKELKEALATFAGIAGSKLRKNGLKAHYLLIFLYQKSGSTSTALSLPLATNYTPDLTRAAHLLLKEIYQEGSFYRKGGILLSELVDEKETQLDLLTHDSQEAKKEAVIRSFDQIHLRFGAHALSFAGEGIEKKWKSVSSRRSPSYTTSWDQLPKVKSQTDL